MITLPDTPRTGTSPHPVKPSVARQFQRRLARALRRCGAGYPASLLHLDVPAAWDVRDAGGRAAAAALREAVAGTVSAHLDDDVPSAPADQCGLTLLLEGARPSRAVHEARNLKRAVDALRFRWHGHPFRLEACVGVLELGPWPEEAEPWLRRAREACAAARDLGGNGVQLVELTEHAWEDIDRRRDWVRHLTEIIG